MNSARARRTAPIRRLGARRAVVLVCLLAGFAARPAAGQDDPTLDSAVRIARLHYEGGGDWYSNPSSLPNWMRGFQQRTGIVAHSDEVVVRPSDDALYRYPIAYMNGHGNVKFSDDEAQILRHWMRAGGFLWADDNYGMDQSFRREVQRIFLDKQLVELPNDHPIFRSFYRLPGLPKIHEHDNLPPQCLAIVEDGRVLLIYTFQSDIGDGLEDPDVHRDPPEKREAAMRMAVNVLMYAMTH